MNNKYYRGVFKNLRGGNFTLLRLSQSYFCSGIIMLVINFALNEHVFVCFVRMDVSSRLRVCAQILFIIDLFLVPSGQNIICSSARVRMECYYCHPSFPNRAYIPLRNTEVAFPLQTQKKVSVLLSTLRKVHACSPMRCRKHAAFFVTLHSRINSLFS